MSNQQTFLTLGLDVGTNSIGWALVREDEQGNPVAIERTGSRIFQEAVDAKTRTPKNLARRVARGARRRLYRKKLRRAALLRLLQANGMLPTGDDERRNVLSELGNYEPYSLRAAALDKKLTPFEFGRALFHINQRRGFKSNRKKSSDNEETAFKQAISSLRSSIAAAGCRTLGEYLAKQERRRNRYPFHDRATDRQMYSDEFDLIWKAQAAYSPSLYTDALKVDIYRTIFSQRALRSQKGLVGKCTFEAQRRRAMKAWPAFQRFRMLQDLNHLQVKNPITREWSPLTLDQRSKIIAKLAINEKMTFAKIRKTLGFIDTQKFNLEETGREHLHGLSTETKIRKIIGEKWDTLTSSKQKDLLSDILTITEDSSALLRRLKEVWNCSEEEASQLASLEFEPGYARLSLRAIKKIIPHLEAGLRYDEACEKAGYCHFQPNTTMSSPRLGEPPQLRNPVVQKALFEIRKLVNGIVRKWGRPRVIRLEMARDVKMGREALREFNMELAKRRKYNEQLRTRLTTEFNIHNPGEADVEKFKLWNELPVCPYTGKVINADALFSPEIEVEHILPYSRSLDDSYANKTLAYASVNKEKGNRSPHEMFSGRQDDYLELLKRIEKLPYNKRKKFELVELKIDDFIERQLKDTQYICVEVKSYLQTLGVPVEVTKGQLTASIRYSLGLNKVLSNSAEKDRSDHRHHAVDALVVAMTSRRILQYAATHAARRGAGFGRMRLNLTQPWETFLEDAAASIQAIVVSHACRRNIAGALHEETAYGFSEARGTFVTRKKIDATITLNQISAIRDPIVRQLVEKRLEERGNKPKEAFADIVARPILHLDGKTPIRKVRVESRQSTASVVGITDDTGRPYKYFALGSNHHIELIENTSNKSILPLFVSTKEAARRARTSKTSVVQRDHGQGRRFLFSLAINDMVQYEDQKLGRNIFRVQKMSGANRSVELRLHSSAFSEYGAAYGGVKISSPLDLARLKKVVVDVLGEIHVCND